jgi:ribosome maturation factor RimP
VTDFEPFIITPSAIESTLIDVVEPVLREQGLELVLLKVSGQSHAQVVMIYLDTVPPAVPITLAQLSDASRLLSRVLDVADADATLFGGAYELEVSSPGVERPLTKLSHFSHALQKALRVRFRQENGENKTVTGTLLDVRPSEGFVIQVHNDDMLIPWGALRTANLVFAPPVKVKPGKEKNQKPRKKS